MRRERALGGGGVRRRASTSTAVDDDILDDGHLEEIILVEGILDDVQAVSDARGGVATDVGSRIDEETREQSVERSSQGARGVRRRTRGRKRMRANADEATAKATKSAIFDLDFYSTLISSDATRFLCNETLTM